MGTVWLKKRYWSSDYDAITHEVLPGAIAPGLYCETEESYDRILADPGIERVYMAPRDGERPRSWPPLSLGGIRVRVATPAEAAFFRAMPEGPPEPEPDIEGAARKIDELISKAAAAAPAPKTPPKTTHDTWGGRFERLQREREHQAVQALQGKLIDPDGNVVSDAPVRKLKPAPFRISPARMLNRAARRTAASKNRRKP